MNTCLKPLADCQIQNGILTVPGLSSEGYSLLATELRKAIIDYKVPHWKIIGVHVKLGNGNQIEDFVTKCEGLNKSYAELLPVLKQVAAGKGGGEPAIIRARTGKSANCFYKKQGDISFIADMEDDITTKTMFYESFPSSHIDFIKDVDILHADYGTFQALMYKGTGCISFNDAMKIIDAYNTNDAICSSDMEKVTYCPMTAVYDLSQFVNVKLYKTGDNFLKLLYKTDIHESVLQDILTQFGEDIVGGV